MTSAPEALAATPKVKAKSSLSSYLRRNFDLYLLLIPGLIFMIIIKILPILGVSIAFVDYNIYAGDNPIDSIFQSEFVGLDIFRSLFQKEEFIQAFRNTLVISVMKIAILFPLPIILALLLNSVRVQTFKKVTQTVLYLPHFLSWVVVGGIFLSLMGTSGVINNTLRQLGIIHEPIRFFMDNSIFRWVLIITEGWKEIGWSSIIYLAALAGVDPELYEPATVDGANGFQRMIHITLPGILSTIILMLTMRVGSVLDAGFTQILVLYNPTVYQSADIIQTYTYRIGLGQMNFSLGTAVGLFNSVIAFVLVISTNFISRKTLGKSIW